jgi:hypothetical protein
MIRTILRKFANVNKKDSLAIKLRYKRMALFKELIAPIPKPLSILDIGGTEIFWENMGLAGVKGIEITLINLTKIETHNPNIKSIVGDARNMNEIQDNEYEIAFSHSVIEHVGGYKDQKKMASEVQRVGKRYFIQTPNFYFPIEPHFLFPFFQFFPIDFKVFLLRHLKLGWSDTILDKEQAKKRADSIRLLKKRELMKMFPSSTVREEKLWGLTISLIAYGGVPPQK